MIDQWFGNRPIRAKLASISMVTTASALLLVLMVMLGYEYIAARDELLQKMEVEASIVQQNSVAALAFSDIRAATEVLASLQASPSVVQAALVLPNGSTFAEYHNKFGKQPSYHYESNGSGTHFALDGLTLYRDISLGDKPIGKLFIEARLDRFYESMKLYAAAFALAALAALALSFSMLKYFNHAITHPLSKLAELTRSVSLRQDYTVRSSIDSHDEIGELARGFNNMLEQIQKRDADLGSELTQRKQAENRLNELAYFDNTTLLPNRHHFKERMEAAIDNALRNNLKFSLMFIDLDDFKIVNDTLGHHIGDELLKKVAVRLSTSLRVGDIVCRIGGDEFAVILTDITDIQPVEIAAKKIIRILSEPIQLESKEVFIGASIGVCLFPDHASDISALLRNADTAMYHAKGQGKNRHQIYQPEMESRAIKRFTLENSLRRALESNELMLYYQPQTDIDSDRIIGFEALMRWRHPIMGMVTPDEFIPVAEETGLIMPMGEWALRTACLQGRAWQQAYAQNLVISVNLSGRQLVQNDIVERVLDILAETGMPPHLLDIELTESSLMENTEENIVKMEKLRAAGIRISIDDFGTGYSSISYLKRFPIDTLKIDRSFIRDIPGDADDVAIANTIIAMGNSLRMSVIAEGVEAEDQLNFLRESGCRKAQGFLLGKPMPAHEAEALLRETADQTAAVS
jgi:diguanylate cyclase